MRAALTFDMNEPDDEIRHAQCVIGRDALLALWKIQENLRNGNKITSDLLFCVLDEYSIDLERLLP